MESPSRKPSLVRHFYPLPSNKPLTLALERKCKVPPAPTSRSYAGTELRKPVFSSAQSRPMERQRHRPVGSQMSYGAPTAKAEDVVSSEGEAPIILFWLLVSLM